MHVEGVVSSMGEWEKLIRIRNRIYAIIDFRSHLGQSKGHLVVVLEVAGSRNKSRIYPIILLNNIFIKGYVTILEGY